MLLGAADGPGKDLAQQSSIRQNEARIMTRIAILTLYITCFPTIYPALAQTGLATVHGRVTDTSGGIVIGAEVEIKNTGTNEAVTGKTGQDGLYTFPAIRPGRYVIRAQKSGFKTVTVNEFSLNVGDNLVRHIMLEVGDVSDSV